MSAATKTEVPATLDGRIFARVLEEGYGPGAWHGNDIRAALADVTPAAAFWRPADGRHSIAEIAVHHAFTVRGALAKMSASPIEPFPLEGDDWFALEAGGPLSWPAITTLVRQCHERLAHFVDETTAGRATSTLGINERFALILGITCHSAYHAGQVQLLKVLHK